MGTTSSIFRADICRGNDQPLDVALKIDPTGKREEDFIREAIQYETGAKELQGIIFPHFHGCFQAEIGPTRVTCLVTEYCGEPMEQSLDVIDNPFLIRLLIAAGTMHLHGLNHGDLYEPNILVHNGHPKIIDLESAVAHKCGIRMRTIPGTIIPTAEEFGCKELHDLIRRANLWRPSVLIPILRVLTTHETCSSSHPAFYGRQRHQGRNRFGGILETMHSHLRRRQGEVRVQGEGRISLRRAPSRAAANVRDRRSIG
ncbi:hypothetical protein B0H13DRAFT_1610334 [Mycena leptocephala]|nr:hypothetical protein B0H13DRAFT_1610334 [Mycena leptocephala]